MLTYSKNTPILFIISNNEALTTLVFEKIRMAAPERLYIAGDWPEAINIIDNHRKIPKAATSIDWDCKLKTRFNKKQVGYNKTVFQAISWFFKNEPEGIILESFYIPSDDFFGFCSTLLEKYRHDERIGHIAGNKNPKQEEINDGSSYFFPSLVNTYGWAGWRRVWKDINKELKTFSFFKKSKTIEKIASHRPFKLQWNNHFKWFLEDKKDNMWESKYRYILLINNRLSIVPNVDLSYFFLEPNKNGFAFTSMKEIVHPLFIIENVVSDWKSQELQFSAPAITLNEPDGSSFMSEKLASFTSECRGRMKIPRIIHQIYEDPAGPPEFLLELAKTWKEHHPDWEYRFWNKAAIHEFLESVCPEFVEYYQAFRFNVQRWDAIRYLILYHIGGLYVDLDYECIQPLDTLLVDSTCCMGMEPTVNTIVHNKPLIIGNALMASVPGHSYFKFIIQDMKDYFNRGTYKGDSIEIMESTGPFMVTRIYEQYQRKKTITLLPADLVTPLNVEEVKLLRHGLLSEEITNRIESAFAIHYFFGSWVPQTAENAINKQNKKIKISYGITVCNEDLKLDRLLQFLIQHIDSEDEILVLADSEKITPEVQSVIRKYASHIKSFTFPLNHDFARFKNQLIKQASGNYMFQIDADEMPHEHLIRSIKETIIKENVDCFVVPRVNYVEGITEELIQIWKWEMDSLGRINYPDLQMRIFKLGRGIKWAQKVHEDLINQRNHFDLPYQDSEEYCLYHFKTIEEQEKQNRFYQKIADESKEKVS